MFKIGTVVLFRTKYTKDPYIMAVIDITYGDFFNVLYFDKMNILHSELISTFTEEIELRHPCKY